MPNLTSVPSSVGSAELKDYTYELLFELYDNKVEYWDF